MYQLKSESWLDKRNECYKKIISITPPPKDADLKHITKLFPRVKLSPFKVTHSCCSQEICVYIIMDPNNICEMLCVNNIVNLFSYLVGKGFVVNTDITKIMLRSDVQIPNLICYITK